jgi:hypothetical protein
LERKQQDRVCVCVRAVCAVFMQMNGKLMREQRYHRRAGVSGVVKVRQRTRPLVVVRPFVPGCAPWAEPQSTGVHSCMIEFELYLISSNQINKV